MVNLRNDAFQTSRIRWEEALLALSSGRARDTGRGGTCLREIIGFGSNPGNLRMFEHRPKTLAVNPALVVVLHGCTQRSRL